MKFILLAIFILSSFLNAKDYTSNKDAQNFIDMMVKKHNYKRSYLETLLSDVKLQKVPLKIYSPLKTIKRPKVEMPKHGAWDRYVKYKVTNKRAQQGVSFIKKYKSTFNEVEKNFGVPKEYIAAIIGIESLYGKNVGKYPVFDTLATLAFEKNRRNKFFTKQLEEFIRLMYKYKIDPKAVKGSYAGAIGLGQFMPSSYKHFGIDFNNDGRVSLLHPQDAIASIANYLKEHGWETNEEVATRVSYEGQRFEKYRTGYNKKYHRKELKGIRPKYGKWDYHDKVRLIKLSCANYDELWYGAKNFYVITRYNHSAYYAMSVHKLAQKIKKNLQTQTYAVNDLKQNSINN